MKSRFNIWKFNYRDIERKANRRLGSKDSDDDKLHIIDWLILAVLVVFLKLKPIPESIPYSEWISLAVALVAMFVLFIVKFRRQAPRTCWRNATWATGMWAVVITIAPFLLYLFDEFPLDMTIQIVVASSVLWVACLGCYLRLRYIRRRSEAEIIRMRLREKRRRKMEYL